MSGLAIFDLDGVLVDSKEIHYEALNQALNEVDSHYVISLDDQALIYEGLTTLGKLEILTKLKGLPKELYPKIWESKQKYSTELFRSLRIDDDLVSLFFHLKSTGTAIAVASNSIRATVDLCLSNLGISKYISLSLSNEDVSNPKPDPQIYLECMVRLGFSPSDTVVFEDSNIGKQAAIASGARLVEVSSRADLTLEKVLKAAHVN